MRPPAFITLVNRCLVVLLAGAAAACATAPPGETGAGPSLPSTWQTPVPTSAEPPLRGDWWQGFGSDELGRLVDEARTDSLELAAATARLRQADASVRVAGASLWPALTAGIEGSRQRGADGATDGQEPRLAATLTARHEVDLWGRGRAVRDGAAAARQASAFDRDVVQLELQAAVATAWLQHVALRERAAISAASQARAERLLDLVDARARAGAASALELAQQRGFVANQRRERAALDRELGAVRHALSVLLGRTGPVLLGEVSMASLSVPVIGAGVPSELLLRRPDVARAEALLAAADADIRVARAAMLPSLTITAGTGSDSQTVRRLFDRPVYSLAAGLAAPIFDAGRLKAQHALTLARREEMLAAYRQVIVEAFGEVETALNAVAGAQAEAEAQADELRQARHALVLAESRYRAGAETLLTLLDAQRTLHAAQDAAAQFDLQRLLSAVTLYRALGGGWRKG